MFLSTLPRQLAVGALLVLAAGGMQASDGPVPISHGETIEVRDHLVPGKTTVVGFYSEYSPDCPCVPCEGFDNPLVALNQAREDVVVVLVDINRPGTTRIDWHSPVAMQFGLRALPHFMIFGPDGTLIAEDEPGRAGAVAREQVHAMIAALPGHSEIVAAAK